MAIRKPRRKQHDAKFRASAVAILCGAGYPDDPYQLEKVATRLGVLSRTLRRWYKGENAPPPAELVTQEKRALADIFEDVARTYLNHALDADVVGDTAGNVAVTAAAISVDKMQLLRGLPTEIIGLVPQVMKALEDAGYDPVQVFNDLIAEAALRKQELSSASTLTES